MTRIPRFKVAVACAMLLGLALAPNSATAEDGFSMIIASDPQFHVWRSLLDPNIPNEGVMIALVEEVNQWMADAMNDITLRAWPPAELSELVYGYDAPIIQPSGVIINGDLTNYWRIDQYEALIEWFDQIQYPKYPGLGDHDMLEEGWYDAFLFSGILDLGFGDYRRASKEAVWWMANQIEADTIANIVNRDIRGFVGLRSDLLVRRSRIGVRYWLFYGPSGEDSISVVAWSEPIPPIISLDPPLLDICHWGFVRIPDKAQTVYVQWEFGADNWLDVTSFSVPEPWQAQCYKVYPVGLFGHDAAPISRPREWPDGDIGGLAYSFDIGPYYHFVQLQEVSIGSLPARSIPLALPNHGDAFYWDRSPALEWSPSDEWLKQDLKAATEAGKYIVINGHGCGVPPDAIRDRNVVAIFCGHNHATYGPSRYWRTNTYNNVEYCIPQFKSGSSECLRFLLAEFHRTYFNVGVIAVEDGGEHSAFVVDTSDCCDPRDWLQGDHSWTHNFHNPLARTFMIPEMFVVNADPTVTAALADTPPAFEGEMLVFEATGTDPDGDSLAYAWDFGDGNHSPEEDPVHTYGDNGAYTVVVTASDPYGGTASAALAVTVENAAPLVAVDRVTCPIAGYLLPGQEVLIHGSFTDPGWLDTHTAQWDFGDATIGPGTLAEEREPPAATGTVTDPHTFGAPGLYPVVLEIADDDGGVATAGIDVRVMTALEAVDAIDSVIQNLPAYCFQPPADQRKHGFAMKLQAIQKVLAVDPVAAMINKLYHDIRWKADGSVDGAPQNDWITDPEAQQLLCQMIDALIAYLESTHSAGKDREMIASAEDSESEIGRNGPTTYSLSQNHPNPFNAGTVISYSLEDDGYTSLEVYDVLGRRVAVLVDGHQLAGEHQVAWNGRNASGRSVASGIYFYRLTANGQAVTRKMVLLR